MAGRGVADAAERSPFAVVGYLPEYRLDGFNYTAAFQSGLTHLIFFSLEVGEDGSLQALDRVPSALKLRRAREAADAVGGKLLLGFGGNARSHGFGPMALKPATRALFLTNLNTLLTKYSLDGVDYNWEYPRNDEEWRAWYSLMKESKEQLLLDGKAIVTFTIYLDPNHYRVISEYKLMDVADFVLCMAYDQNGKHSTEAFFSSGIDYALRFKIPLSKFVNGLPFYGRDTRNGEPKTYGELIPKIEAKFGNAAFDISADSVQTKHGHFDTVHHQYYNARNTIAFKTQEALRRRIGGVMIWELGQDVQPVSDARSLLTAIQETVRSAPETSDL